MQVPEGTNVQEVPPVLFAQERKVLAATMIDNYKTIATALQANHEQFSRY